MTLLLKNSLGGNAKTTMIANVSPSEKSILETLNTLRFAQNCKKVKNSAKINEDMSGSIEKLKQEIV